MYFKTCKLDSMTRILNRNLSSPFAIHRRRVYWPPPKNKRSQMIELPSGKKCFVFMGKRDADGKYEPVLCFIDKNGDKLMWLNAEELHQFEKLSPRLLKYFDLWEQFKDET